MSPWSMSNPPPPAENWSDSEKEKCIAAANAVLEDGKTEQDAIFACIHTAGKGKGEKFLDAEKFAWNAVRERYEQDEGGNWVAKKEMEPALAFSEKSGIPLLSLWDYGEADLTVLGETVTGRVQVAEFGLEGGEKGLRCYLHFDPALVVDDGEPVMNVFAPLKNTSEDGLKEALLQIGTYLEETARPFG